VFGQHDGFLMRATLPFIIFVCLLLSACGISAPQVYQAYFFVDVPADATATPTPFQPEVFPQLAEEQSTPKMAQATRTLPALLPTLTPFATATEAPPQPTLAAIETPAIPIDAPETLVYLLLGADTQGGATSFRTDSILAVAVRPWDGQVSVISFPRDLWVNIPTVGLQRINTAYLYGENNHYPGGGSALLKDTMLNNFGLEIQQTALVDFDGFRRVVDTLGGIEVPIACPYTDWRLISPDLNPHVRGNWALYTAGPGLVQMDGDLALWYARSRQKSNDFDRGRRQQEVLRALFKKTISTNTLTSLPQLYSDLNDSIKTDVGLTDVLSLAPLALQMNNADIRSYYISSDMVTDWITPGGAYVLLPHTEAIQAMLTESLSASQIQEERQLFSIEVQNGSAYDGWDVLAAERLNYAGFQTAITSAEHRQYPATLLYDLSEDQDAARAARLLAILGLKPDALFASPNGPGESDYLLVLGNDYQPCFQPAELTP
jgi:polyisoprenyl-teichoic acid--peptidoglycan teichoic acid transferase